MRSAPKIPRGKGQRVTLDGIARKPDINFLAKVDNRTGIQAQSLVFNLEVVASDGSIRDSIPVALEGWEIRGNLLDGDRVHLSGKFDKYNVLKVKEIFKRDTNSYVTAKSLTPSRKRRVAKYIIGIIVLLVILWFFNQFLSYL
jgi:hypothetical protein